MKIKEGTDLSKYGFELLDSDDDYCLKDKWCFMIGHSRRGQFYYYTVGSDMQLRVFATDPDGSGGDIVMDSVLLKMFEDGVLE